MNRPIFVCDRHADVARGWSPPTAKIQLPNRVRTSTQVATR